MNLPTRRPGGHFKSARTCPGGQLPNRLPGRAAVTLMVQMSDADLLAATPLFQRLPPEALASVLEETSTRTLARNDELFTQNDEAHDLFVVREGRIAISTRARDGRESLVALMEPGDLFGEMSMFDGLGRSAGARALEPSIVLSVPYAPVRQALDDRPQVPWDIV